MLTTPKHHLLGPNYEWPGLISPLSAGTGNPWRKRLEPALGHLRLSRNIRMSLVG